MKNLIIIIQKKNAELNEENDSIKGIKININENNDITTLECGHQFHTTCISKWLKQRDNCPLYWQAVKYKNNLDDAHLIWEYKMKDMIIDIPF